MHSFAYRSNNRFVSEPIMYGSGTSPVIEHPERYELPKNLRKMMNVQRARELSKPINQRASIGGEIQTFLLSKDGFIITTLGRLGDSDMDDTPVVQNSQGRLSAGR
jgi:hypothetical protein